MEIDLRPISKLSDMTWKYLDPRPISKLCQSPGNIQPVQYLVWFQFPLHFSAKTCILPIQDSSSGEMVKSEQSAMSCGVTMAGKALLIP